jgi:glyoxylase-like metal-dependent hydrolase (beta-lactamase superfamily II)
MREASASIHLVGSGFLGSNLTDPYDCNIYLLDGDSGRALIDCGSGLGVPALVRELARRGFAPRDIGWIIVTHSHADHSGAAEALRRLTGARVVASRATARIMRAGEALMKLDEARAKGIYPAHYRYVPCSPDLEVGEGDRLAVGDLTLEVIATPGHSHDHISLYCPELGALFCGDVVFEGGRIAVQQAPDFSLDALQASIVKLAARRIVGLYPGHKAPLADDGGRTLHLAAQRFAAGAVPDSIV